MEKDIKRISELVECLEIIEGLNCIDEILERNQIQQLEKNFLEQNEKTLKEVFRKGEINKFPELYKFFFLNKKLPKIISSKNLTLVKDAYDKAHIRPFRSINFNWTREKGDKKYSEVFKGILEFLPPDIRETVFCFIKMCNLLGSRSQDYMKTQLGKIFFYCRQANMSRSHSELATDTIYFIVSYKEKNFQYNLIGDLEMPFEYTPRFEELYTDIFQDACTTKLKINLDYLSRNSINSIELKDINSIFRKFAYPELLLKRTLTATSLAALREEANYFNLVILPIEYSKFRLDEKYNEVVNCFTNRNIFLFVMTSLDNYDPWGEIIEQEESKSKFFPNDLFQLELSLQFSIVEQKNLYQMLSTLEKRFDELENIFNKNMKILEKQIQNLTLCSMNLQKAVETLSLKLIGMEYGKISSNKEKFIELKEKIDEVRRDWPCNNSKIRELEYEQNSLIDSNHISSDVIEDIIGNMNLGISVDEFKLKFLEQKATIEEIKQKINKRGHIFIYTDTSDICSQDAIAYYTF